MKDDFKEFVRTKPSLVSHVNRGNMTWQKFYDMYKLYGKDAKVWQDYDNTYVGISTPASAVGEVSTLKQMFNAFKGMDLTTVQNGIGSIQQGIDLLQDLFVKNKTTSTSTRDTYEPRPMHRYFDD